jgi:predicted ArsR family transcriptional regulator
MTPDATTRAAALKIMANGHATIAEIAELVGISRQAVRMWAQRAKIDPVANRENYLADLWAKANGQPAQPRSSQPKRRQR